VVKTLCAGMLQVGKIIPRKCYKHLLNIIALADVCPFYRNHYQILANCIVNTMKTIFEKKIRFPDFGQSLLFYLLPEKD
jgi:hypothetical protein